MTNYIKVSNTHNKATWQKELTNEEFQTVKTYLKSKKTLNPFHAAVIPVRTNNLKNFSKDFFLPTVVNHALKVHHEVGEVFAFLGALVLDVISFPIRLFSCIPGTISNAKQKEHPLHKYLRMEGVSGRLLASNHVHVKLEWRFGQEHHWSKENVNFIELPYFKGDVYSAGMSSF